MRTEAEAARALEQYGDMVRRVCFLHLKNHADTEDVFQDVFLKYVLYEQPFENAEHEKAWLLRVSVNACKDKLKGFFRSKVLSIEDVDVGALAVDDADKELLDCVLRLPPNHRDAIYLHYYEGYSAVEIAGIMGKKENTVYSWLTRARKALGQQLGGEPLGE